MIGLIVFATAVAVIWTVLYVAYFRSGSTIQAATGQQQEPYTAMTEQDSSFLDGDFPEQPDRAYRAVHAQRRIAKQPSQMPMRRQP